ncbi:HNH endonuclease [Bordetella bronchialis]|uniref:HNH endonuclease n=1 Tax=Bordetella bronchialis TaxID=463025 RepID=A0A193FT03_9BORD|nr:HNH endonuclease [Bordetella bronchialis]ANN70882.1 HNH endonuclease [Bordetella bronchialis]
MRLTKQQREELRGRFGGRCAYCGEPLGDKWHADHLEAVFRDTLMEVRNKRLLFRSGAPTRLDLDNIANLMPACPPCNIDKSTYKLEDWRAKLSRSCAVLMRNQPTYRHAVRFGLVAETGATVQFYFERAAAQGDGDGRAH